MDHSAATPLANQLAGMLGAWRGGMPTQMMTGGMPYRVNQYQGQPQPLFGGQPQGPTGLNFRSAMKPPWMQQPQMPQQQQPQPWQGQWGQQQQPPQLPMPQQGQWPQTQPMQPSQAQPLPYQQGGPANYGKDIASQLAYSPLM